MVMSQTYRQSSLVREADHQLDPANRWLARQGRFRLDAEMVRDNALAVSGLLSPEIGGPSVKPYQPAGYWSFLNFPTRDYVARQGRRASIAAASTPTGSARSCTPACWRSTPPPARSAWSQRPRSNTPLQALVLLNDPTYVEAARVLAERLCREGGPHPSPGSSWPTAWCCGATPARGARGLAGARARSTKANIERTRRPPESCLSVGDTPPPRRGSRSGRAGGLDLRGPRAPEPARDDHPELNHESRAASRRRGP